MCGTGLPVLLSIQKTVPHSDPRKRRDIKDMIYNKVQKEYNGKILKKRSVVKVNKDLKDVRMIYDMNTGITVSFGDLRTYSTNTKLAMKLRDTRVNVNALRDAIRSKYSFTQTILLFSDIPKFHP